MSKFFSELEDAVRDRQEVADKLDAVLRRLKA